MFIAKVYRVMVGSLSGAMEEVYVAKETIRKWNQQNAERTGKVFMPIEWGTSLEAIQNVDVVVGIIDNWIDNSGYVDNCVDAGKRVILLFNAVHDSTNTIYGEQEIVRAYLNKMSGICRCVEYNKSDEFQKHLNESLFSF